MTAISVFALLLFLTLHLALQTSSFSFSQKTTSLLQPKTFILHHHQLLSTPFTSLSSLQSSSKAPLINRRYQSTSRTQLFNAKPSTFATSTPNKVDPPTALILIDHGSSIPTANVGLKNLAETINSLISAVDVTANDNGGTQSSKHNIKVVKHCHMECYPPTLEEVCINLKPFLLHALSMFKVP